MNTAAILLRNIIMCGPLVAIPCALAVMRIWPRSRFWVAILAPVAAFSYVGMTALLICNTHLQRWLWPQNPDSCLRAVWWAAMSVGLLATGLAGFVWVAVDRRRFTPLIDAVFPYKNPYGLVACCMGFLAIIPVAAIWLLHPGLLQGIVPLGVVDAIIGYRPGLPGHLSLFLLLFAAILFGLGACILGTLGLRYAKNHPQVQGKVQAWIGIIVGGLFGLFQCGGAAVIRYVIGR